MSDDLFDGSADAPAAPPGLPALPEPRRLRWQPLRLGLVELFHYDAEEFWFHDGHLLLRGNNGTGKSKVLSLTLPFLLDAQLRASRIEPDGDAGKKMAWNLLLDSYPRRIGYAWIEFGQRADDGTPRYLTLGAGLSAVAGRAQVDSWYFILEHRDGGPRIGQDVWLTGTQGAVLTRERLRDAVEGRGLVFDTAATYRRAVDERLFRLGTRRYDALMDTLIQLRQPQLSRKPDEAGLSHALGEALPPLPQELLADVAEALNQLEEDQRQLEEARQLALAVERFDHHYRLYAGMQSRRQARVLRQAQTEFDNASQARGQAQAGLGAAQTAEAAAQTAHDDADRTLTAQRARLDTLRADPTMKEANRLEEARAESGRRAAALRNHQDEHDRADRRLRDERQDAAEAAQHAARAEKALADRRWHGAAEAAAAGLTAFSDSPMAALPPLELAVLPQPDADAAVAALRRTVADRRQQIGLLRRRHQAARQAGQTLAQQEQARQRHRTELDDAVARRAAADAAAETAGQAFVDAWTAHCAGLVELRFEVDADDVLRALAEWVARPEGDDPARQALLSAQQQAGLRHARRQADLSARREAVADERTRLDAERAGLVAGADAAPPVPPTRGAGTREGRAGAPLWQLIDFRDPVGPGERAGLEAALEASGLLDAWVTPDGSLAAADDGTPWLDAQWTLRPPVPGPSLGDRLCAVTADDAPVPAAVVQHLLDGVHAGLDDAEAAEAWIAPDGRFRLGSLRGAWTKPQAVHVGYAARAAARRQRLDAIARRLGELAGEDADLAGQLDRLAADRRQAEHEWRQAPGDRALREALLRIDAAARDVAAARARLDAAEAACRDAERGLHAAREAVERDALDMRLPAQDGGALDAVEDALHRFNDAQHVLAQAASDWRRAHADHRRQQAREAGALDDARRAGEQLAAARLDADAARARFEALRDTVGTRVEDLHRQLADTRSAVEAGEAALRKTDIALRQAVEGRVRAAAAAETAEATFGQRTEARTAAVEHLQRFAASSLLSSALPQLDLPDPHADWTIDPALTLARRIEQQLAQLQDDDDAWARVQRHLAGDLTELQRALGALGHQAPAEPSDWGLVVHVIVHGRTERPDQLAARLADDIAQRSELLSAREREVLENYLQAEIASEVQRLLRAAEKQVEAINRELHKRPTSTGVRYRLRWQPLGENEGAPAGLEAARARLLHTSADLWSAEDRQVVGRMLQQRIAAERAEADAGRGGETGGGLIDQLARALDYRRWHRFRVERLQDGQWRKLSGPASSGERALGLTVPLFAAVASFYSQGSHPHAPRLMLLDEAFAGIDDAARAHCMGLIREFDLDFVITSEREWGCYAELPGVSICQLQRREGIDAVHVSRWTWDGTARRREDDPDRRFPPAA